MIKDRNIAANAGIQLSKILGPGQVGETFWLAGVDTKEYEILQNRVDSDKLFVDSTKAINAMDANQGDVLYVAPNYTETIAGAAGLNVNKAGIEIICLGEGAVRPTFTFSATASTITFTAASVTMKNFIVVPSIDSVVSPLVVSAPDYTLDYEVQDASDTVECVNSLLTTAAADRLNVNCKYVGKIGGNACVNSILLVGVDTARINVDFYGVASTAIVEFHTTACHNVVITGSFYNDGTSLTMNVIDTVGGSTWSAKGWDGNSNANFTGGDNATIASDDVSAVASAITSGVPQTVTKSTGDLTASGTSVALFTVTGDVLVKVGASVDVAVTSTSGTSTAEVGVAGNTACLCIQDVIDNTAFAVGDSWSLITAADTNGAQMADEWILIGNGVDIAMAVSVDDITAGDMDFYCQFIPLSSDGAVVAA